MKKIILLLGLFFTISNMRADLDVCNPKNDDEKTAILALIKKDLSSVERAEDSWWDFEPFHKHLISIVEGPFGRNYLLSEDSTIQKIVDHIAINMGYDKKIRVFVSYSMPNNAVALNKILPFNSSLLGSSDQIAIGFCLSNLLNYDEFNAIIAHEIGHIKNYHSYKIKVAMIASILACNLLPKQIVKTIWNNKCDTKSFDGYFNNYNDKISVVSNVVVVSVGLLYLKLSRKFEEEADLESYSIFPNPDFLPNGLEKMIGKKKANFVSKIKNLFSTHPNICMRRQRLQEIHNN